MRRSFAWGIFFILLFTGASAGENLKVLYFERPPYYMTSEKGQASGFLLELAMDILQDAGIDFSLHASSPMQIMYQIEANEGAVCSVGWFRNSKREKIARFSMPIYQDKPISILTTRENKPLLSAHSSISSLFKDKALMLGVVKDFSYGSYINQELKENHVRREVASDQKKLLSLLVSKRISYMFIAAEEFETLLHSEGHSLEQFASITMPDIPSGNDRYLIFSKSVRPEIIKKVNDSIYKLVKY